MTDGKKLVQEILDGKRVSPSMGCQVASTPCPICGRASAHSHKDGVVVEDGIASYEPQSNVELIAFSMVEGPTCKTCGVHMVYTRQGTIWRCETEWCDDQGNTTNPGFGGVVERV